MIDLIKSLNPTSVFWFLVALVVSSWFKFDHDQLKKEKQQLRKDLATADSIIHAYDKIINQADSAIDKNTAQLDSLQQKRHENDTSTYMLSADSLHRLWAERFNHNHQH